MSRVFISGETIDLCVPHEDDIEVWANWFNDPKVTRFLEQGKYPNSPAMQRQFLTKAVDDGRFLATIKTKSGKLLGVVSLSEISYEKRTAQLSYVCPVKEDSARFASLEAAAHAAQHAFERFGVDRVWSGHAYPGLGSWIRKMEILGFWTEGFFEGRFKHGREIGDSISTALTLSRYQELACRRGGNLWPGETNVKRLLEELGGLSSLADQVVETVKSLHAEKMDVLCSLE